jgi:hypothetical protein
MKVQSKNHGSTETDGNVEQFCGVGFKGDKIRQLNILCAKVEKLSLASNPIRRTYQQLRIPFYLKEPGCWLEAPYGQGKTIAMNFCARSLREEILGLQVFVINEHVLPGNELRSFFVRALTESKHDKPLSSYSDALRNRLSKYWAELSYLSPLGSVVLLLDEAQAMRSIDESLLKDLVNEIAHMHGSLQIFTFGESPSLGALVEKRTAKASMNGAVDRLFGGHRIRLHYYETEKDWASLFEEMDSQIFDEMGGMTIVQAFFGHMDMSGFSMKNEANRFFVAHKKITKEQGSWGLNLRRTFVGIRHALLMTALISVEKKQTAISKIAEEQWGHSLRYCCLASK